MMLVALAMHRMVCTTVIDQQCVDDVGISHFLNPPSMGSINCAVRPGQFWCRLADFCSSACLDSQDCVPCATKYQSKAK